MQIQNTTTIVSDPERVDCGQVIALDELILLTGEIHAYIVDVVGRFLREIDVSVVVGGYVFLQYVVPPTA